MSDTPEYNLDGAIAELRAEQARIQEVTEQMSKLTGSATSKDRMITATVDSQGRLIELELAGTRYRQLAPKELTTRIVSTVREAQDKASRVAASTLSGLLPEGLGLPVDHDFDLGAMFDAAISAARATTGPQSPEGRDSNG